MLLDRRALHAPVGAEHAAVTGFRPEQLAAAHAVIEKLAGIDRHGLGGLMAAMRTGQRALQNRLYRHEFLPWRAVQILLVQARAGVAYIACTAHGVWWIHFMRDTPT